MAYCGWLCICIFNLVGEYCWSCLIHPYKMLPGWRWIINIPVERKESTLASWHRLCWIGINWCNVSYDCHLEKYGQSWATGYISCAMSWERHIHTTKEMIITVQILHFFQYVLWRESVHILGCLKNKTIAFWKDCVHLSVFSEQRQTVLATFNYLLRCNHNAADPSSDPVKKQYSYI